MEKIVLTYFCAGAAAGAAAGTAAGAAAGTGMVVCVGAALFCVVLVFTVLSKIAGPALPLRVEMIDKDSDVTMNSAAAKVVALDKTVADPRGPKTVCEPMPPNAPARSAALPLCSSTTIARNKHTIT